jgi:hypothetical protein
MSLPEEAPRDTNQEEVAEAVEREIELLQRLRPALEARIARAASILVVHLSSPKAGILKVRTRGGRPRVLVRSTSNNGAVYVVDPGSWSCTCPDFHRRGTACKHCVAAYVLWQVSRRSNGCGSCHRGVVYMGERVVDPRTGEETEVQRPVRCQRCSGGNR